MLKKADVSMVSSSATLLMKRKLKDKSLDFVDCLVSSRVSGKLKVKEYTGLPKTRARVLGIFLDLW